MSLYEGRECPECDGPTELRGQLCTKCEMKPHIDAAQADMRARTARETERTLAIRIGDTEAARAAIVRGALNAIATAMHGDRPARHAFRNLAEHADDKSLAQLGRMLK